MNVKKIISAILFASACVHSEGIDSADAEYCFDLRKKQEYLLLVKKNNDLEKIRTTEENIDSENYMVECKYFDESVKTEVDFRNELGEIIGEFYYNHSYISGWGCDCDTAYTHRLALVPTWIKVEFPQDMFNTRMGVQEKDWLRYKNKIVDGHITVSTKCEPAIDTTYHFKFRAKITGKCTAEFLSGYDRSKRR